MLCFTYFRVMPEFLDFLFSFGYQSRAQDPYFSSFRQRTCMSGLHRAFDIPELAWSAKEMQICYNLKSVERSGSSLMDWTIRSCAIHHTLDLKNVRGNWIIIKSNDIMKDRLEQATSNHRRHDMSSFETLDKSFTASLTVHLILCDWAAEGWRWYINGLDDQFQNTSRRTVAAPLNLPLSLQVAKEGSQPNSHTDVQRTEKSILNRLLSAPLNLIGKLYTRDSKSELPLPGTYTDPDTGLSQPLPPHVISDIHTVSLAQMSQPPFVASENQEFSFPAVQKYQHIEEKAHEAQLILKQNMSVFHQLRQHYNTITKSACFPQEIVQKCQGDLEQFNLSLEGVFNDLQMHILRLETLLRLLGDRKNLVFHDILLNLEHELMEDNQLHSILEYHNTEINKLSTKNMMSMTEDMNDIARKTKIETVSMKVITLVTLFFLPGTFISVRKLFLHLTAPPKHDTSISAELLLSLQFP